MAFDYFGYNPHQRDFQDDWNTYAANQNADVRTQQMVQPGPDPRALAAQSLIHRYAPQAPSYANVQGQHYINDQPITVMPPMPGIPVSLTGQQGADLQFAGAKRQAAQDYLNRQSGNFAAGTANRPLLQDDAFMRLPDDYKRPLYSQIYGTSLAEDQQADRLGGNMTVQQLRYRNDLPNRQKADKEWLATIEANTGQNPFMLASNYNRGTGRSTIPGHFVKSHDEMGNETTIQMPATDVPMEPWLIDSINQRMAHMGGMEQYPTPQAPNMDHVWNWNTTGPARDPARDQRIHNAMTQSQSTLQRNGIALSPDDFQRAIRLAVSLAGGQEYTEQQLVTAARRLQDTNSQHARQVAAAQAVYNARMNEQPAMMSEGAWGP